jgi:conjugative relaxase-like TrwC/TraI family protein
LTGTGPGAPSIAGFTLGASNVIRKTQFRNTGGSKGAARYFTEHLDDRAHEPGKLEGREVWRLGLGAVEINQTTFAALERNLHPLTGERITPRMNGEGRRRTGLDQCFVVPKTVAVWLRANRGRPGRPGELARAVEGMIDDSWAETMAQAEALAQTRVRIGTNGQGRENRDTGNLVYFRAVHTEARPEDKAPDPFYHIHTYAFNLTWDPIENRWKAAELSNLVKRLDDLDAFFLCRLEGRLNQAGIGTERTRDGRSFELSGVAPELKETFSKRRARILEEQAMPEVRERLKKRAAARVKQANEKGSPLDFEQALQAERNRHAHARAKAKRRQGAGVKHETFEGQLSPEERATLSPEAIRSAPRRGWADEQNARSRALALAFAQTEVAHEWQIAAELVRATGSQGKDGNDRIREALEWVRSEPRLVPMGSGLYASPAARAMGRAHPAPRQTTPGRPARQAPDPQKAPAFRPPPDLDEEKKRERSRGRGR